MSKYLWFSSSIKFQIPDVPAMSGYAVLSVNSLCNVRLQLKYDGTRWRTGGKVTGKPANGVGSQYSSHYLGTWCIQHYYRWCTHLSCQRSTELTSPVRFKWTRPFHRKTKSGFCACAITFQLVSMILNGMHGFLLSYHVCLTKFRLTFILKCTDRWTLWYCTLCDIKVTITN